MGKFDYLEGTPQVIDTELEQVAAPAPRVIPPGVAQHIGMPAPEVAPVVEPATQALVEAPVAAPEAPLVDPGTQALMDAPVESRPAEAPTAEQEQLAPASPDRTPLQTVAAENGIPAQAEAVNNIEADANSANDLQLMADQASAQVEAETAQEKAEERERYAQVVKTTNDEYMVKRQELSEKIGGNPLKTPGSKILSVIAAGLGGILEVTTGGRVKSSMADIIDTMAAQEAQADAAKLNELKSQLGDNLAAEQVLHANYLDAAVAAGDAKVAGIKSTEAQARWYAQRSGISEKALTLRANTMDRMQKYLADQRDAQIKMDLNAARIEKLNRRGRGGGGKSKKGMYAVGDKVYVGSGTLKVNGAVAPYIDTSGLGQKEKEAVRAVVRDTNQFLGVIANLETFDFDRTLLKTQEKAETAQLLAKVRLQYQNLIKGIPSDKDSQIIDQAIGMGNSKEFFRWVGSEGYKKMVMNLKSLAVQEANSALNTYNVSWDGPTPEAAASYRKKTQGGSEAQVVKDIEEGANPLSAMETAGANATRDERTASRRKYQNAASKALEVSTSKARALAEKSGVEGWNKKGGLDKAEKALRAKGGKKNLKKADDLRALINKINTQRMAVRVEEEIDLYPGEDKGKKTKNLGNGQVVDGKTGKKRAWRYGD